MSYFCPMARHDKGLRVNSSAELSNNLEKQAIGAKSHGPWRDWPPACWRYSNAAISQPRRKLRFAPLAVIFHPLERAIRLVVEDGFVGVDESVFHAGGERSAGGGFELLDPGASFSFSCNRSLHHVD